MGLSSIADLAVKRDTPNLGPSIPEIEKINLPDLSRLKPIALSEFEIGTLEGVNKLSREAEKLPIQFKLIVDHFNETEKKQISKMNKLNGIIESLTTRLAGLSSQGKHLKDLLAKILKSQGELVLLLNRNLSAYRVAMNSNENTMRFLNDNVKKLKSEIAESTTLLVSLRNRYNAELAFMNDNRTKFSQLLKSVKLDDLTRRM